MYEDEKNMRTSMTSERADSPTYLDISASKTSAFTNMKTGNYSYVTTTIISAQVTCMVFPTNAIEV